MEQRVDIKIDGDAVTLQGFGSALTKPTKFLSTLIIIHTAEERSLCSAQGKPTANQPSRYLPKYRACLVLHRSDGQKRGITTWRNYTAIRSK